jgi:hypothetical protein
MPIDTAREMAQVKYGWLKTALAVAYDYGFRICWAKEFVRSSETPHDSSTAGHNHKTQPVKLP